VSAMMDAVVLHGKEDARLERVPVPEPGPGEVRVRIRAALTCGTDLKVFRRGYHAKMIVPPAIFGHELAGEIDALGAGVRDWEVGQRVVAANSAPCGECYFCGIDREELCQDLLFLNGAYAEHIVIPERIVCRNLLPIEDHVPFETAALVEPLACAVHGAAEAGVRAGETVLVIGAGPLGLLLVRCAALVGARVLCAGRRADRLQAAVAMGASETFDVEAGDASLHGWVQLETEGRGADRVIEAVGAPEAWSTAIGAVRRGGTVNLFGGCPAGTSVTVDTARMHYDALTLLGTFHHTPATIRRSLLMLTAGQIPGDVLLQARSSLHELPTRLAELARGGGPLKVVVSANQARK
jgi:L-iditol 2-dehydrogenase